MRTAPKRNVATPGHQSPDRQRHKSKAERELRKYLDTIPGSIMWRIDAGVKHDHLIVGDKMIGVLCHGRKEGKNAKQLISAVKLRLRELEAVT